MKAAVKCKLLLYADDSALLASSSDVSEIEDVLSRELESVSEWLLKTACHCTSVKLNQYYLGPTSGLLREESYTSHVMVMTLNQGQRSLILDSWCYFRSKFIWIKHDY